MTLGRDEIGYVLEYSHPTRTWWHASHVHELNLGMLWCSIQMPRFTNS